MINQTFETKSINSFSDVHKFWKENGIRVSDIGSLHEKGYKDYFSTNQDYFIGMYNREKIIGSCVLFNDGRKTGIYRLCVHNDYRKQGIAKALIKSCEAQADKDKIKTLYALIECSNIHSMTLFDKAGFNSYPKIKYFVKKKKSDNTW